MSRVDETHKNNDIDGIIIATQLARRRWTAEIGEDVGMCSRLNVDEDIHFKSNNVIVWRR